jgi:hypothetical protein
MPIETAAGTAHTRAIHVVRIPLVVRDKWECYEVPNVVILEICASVLNSTGAMRHLFRFINAPDGCLIRISGARQPPLLTTLLLVIF